MPVWKRFFGHKKPSFQFLHVKTKYLDYTIEMIKLLVLLIVIVLF